MSLLKLVVAWLVIIARTLLYGWAIALWKVLGDLLAMLRRDAAKKCLPGRKGKASPKSCVPISNPAVKRPDPLIYDQYYLMALGFAITWDNPDIRLELAGVPVASEDLLPNTTYDVFAQIWNGSTEGVIVGLPVHFSFLSFGAGVQSNPLLPGPDLVHVDLGVKGSGLSPAIAQTKWTTPPAGHYCIQVSFSWLDDANPFNNLGQENTNVRVSFSPVDFQFQLRNDKRQPATYRFEFDTYVIPPVAPCPEGNGRQAPPPSGKPFEGRRVPPQHDRRNYPLPDGWTVSFFPANPQLVGGEEITVTATVNPAPGFKGRQAVNVHAFSDAGLAGGMTFYVKGA